MDAAQPDAGPAADALVRWRPRSGRLRHPALARLLSASPVGPDTDRARHAAIAERLRRVAERGRRNGELDPDWLVAAAVGLAHLAGEKQDAGRMSEAAAAGAPCEPAENPRGPRREAVSGSEREAAGARAT